MRQIPHSLVSIIRSHVEAWRRDTRLSREKFVQMIVEAHEEVGDASAIVFDPVTRDEDDRKKVNAERVFRWLDDITKSNNLLPANFIPSILTAMPIERRLACASEIMVSIGLGACLPSDAEEGELDINAVFEAQREDLDANQALALAIQHPTPENLDAAGRKLLRSQKRKENIQKILAFTRKVGGVIGRFTHPKKEAA